jgi:hypothetical protein
MRYYTYIAIIKLYPDSVVHNFKHFSILARMWMFACQHDSFPSVLVKKLLHFQGAPNRPSGWGTLVQPAFRYVAKEIPELVCFSMPAIATIHGVTSFYFTFNVFQSPQ